MTTRLPHRRGGAWLALVLLACGDGPTASRAGECADAGSGAPIALEPLSGITVTGESAECIALSDPNAAYLVVPQFIAPELGFARYSFAVRGTIEAPIAPSIARRDERGDALDGGATPQQRLDAILRATERSTANPSPRSAPSLATGPGVDPRPAPTGADPPVVGTTRTFSVLSSLGSPLTFATSTARLTFVGTRILVYVDQAAPAVLDDQTWARLGALLDGPLFETDVGAFGDPSDIDGNGRVIVLMTPIVNALVTQMECATSGFVNGFFFGHDLGSSSPTSNRGEVFYALVPDPLGAFSCPHSAGEVERVIPPTFVHELQHMISYGEHVLERGGEPESVWLNEGLSYIAEELASRYFEDRYPAPSGRSDPSQLLPDSAAAFMVGNLYNSYLYLERPDNWSVTVFDPAGFGSLEERGAAWLFLRWLGDRRGSAVYAQLSQTALTGIDNVEAVADDSFASLFGDFSIALWADSIPGVPRSSVPAPYRFQTRNLRRLYLALHAAVPARAPKAFPLEPTDLRTQSAFSMRPTTVRMLRLVTGATGRDAIRFTAADGSRLPTSRKLQVSVFRLPDP